MRFAPARFPDQDERAALGDKIGRERRAEERQPERRLIGEVEIVDRFEKRKPRPVRHAPEPRLLAVRNFFRHEQREQVRVRPGLAFRAIEEIAPHAARVGEVEALEQRIEIDGREIHRGGRGDTHGTSSGRKGDVAWVK